MQLLKALVEFGERLSTFAAFLFSGMFKIYIYLISQVEVGKF